MSETTAGDCAGNYTITRTFTATDDAGNSTSATQTITVQDTTAPEFTSVPADYTAECSDELILDDASASDNCGTVSIEVSSETLAGDAAGNYTVVRTFTATDDCGNSTSATQTITVQDTTAPELTIPALTYTAECSDDLVMDAASASDNCGEVSIEEVSETIAGDCCRQLHNHAHVHCDGRRWQQHVCDADHHGPGHDCSGIHEHPSRLHSRVLRRIDSRRCHCFRQLRRR